MNVFETFEQKISTLPAISLSDAGTLFGANIIGKEPDKPFVSPNTAVNAKDGISP